MGTVPRDYLIDQMILNGDGEDELDTQKYFLWSIHNAGYTETTVEMLQPVVHKIDRESMTFTVEEGEELIRMAGGVPDPRLGEYIKEDYRYGISGEGLCTFETYTGIGELMWDHQVLDTVKLEDGCVSVTGKSVLNKSFGVVNEFEVLLTPNEGSVFGGYSVERYRKKVADLPGTEKIGETVMISDTYKKPKSKSGNPFDYIFELDGSLYQMPVPVKEFLDNGWTLDKNERLREGDRVAVCLSKNGQSLSAGILNYDINTCDYKDCYVVWLKTETDNRWAEVDFNLMDGVVQSGMREADLKEPVTCYWYRKTPGDYATLDPLYNNKYGYQIYPEKGIVAGFEIGYAPNPLNRSQRLDLLTEKWKNDPVIKTPYGETIDVEFGHIYEIDIDEDGRKESIDIRFLDGAAWGHGILCVIVDGTVTASVEGRTDILTDVTARMDVKNKGVLLTVDGSDAQGNQIHEEYIIKKGWSLDITGVAAESNATIYTETVEKETMKNTVPAKLNVEQVLEIITETGNDLEHQNYIAYACNTDSYDRNMQYKRLICLDLNRTPQFVTQEDDKCRVNVFYRVFPDTEKEFIAEGEIEFVYDTEQNTWRISDVFQPYCEFFYSYMPDDIMKKLETECRPYADMVFGTYKIEEDLPEKKDLDLWLEKAGTIDMHQSVYPLFSHRGDILNSSKVWLDKSHIEGLDPIWTYFAIQEIYARHGKKFTEPLLHWYFSMQDWYQPWEYDFADEKISETENDNIELLMKHAGFINDSNFRDIYSKYVEISNYGLVTDEKAECMITEIEIALKKVMEIDYSYPDEQEEPLGGFILKGHLNQDALETYLLEYADKKALEEILKVMNGAGLYFSETYNSYSMYTGGERIYSSIDWKRPFTVIDCTDNKVTVNIPIWIGSVSGLGPSRSEVTLIKNKMNEWIIGDLIVDMDKVVS